MRVFNIVLGLALLSSQAIGLEYGIASVDDGNATPYDDGNYHYRIAAGAMFNPNSMTAAHRKHPLGSLVQVINMKSGEKIYVKINDVGPCGSAHCQRRRPDLLKRIIDLTPYAADQLGIEGLGPVSVRLCTRHHGLMVCQ